MDTASNEPSIQSGPDEASPGPSASADHREREREEPEARSAGQVVQYRNTTTTIDKCNLCQASYFGHATGPARCFSSQLHSWQGYATDRIGERMAAGSEPTLIDRVDGPDGNLRASKDRLSGHRIERRASNRNRSHRLRQLGRLSARHSDDARAGGRQRNRGRRERRCRVFQIIHPCRQR
jgi:hypothetical protein